MTLKLIKSLLIGAILTFNTISVQGKIMIAHNMREVQAQVNKALKKNRPEDILVAFDIDMVLTQPDHPAVYYPTLMKYAKVYKKILGSLSAEQKDFANTLTTQNYPQKFVEEETPEVVKRIEEKGIKVIAFTATLTGKFNNIKDKIIALRRDDLQKKGLDFTKSFKESAPVISFTEFPAYASSYPMFDRGILSSNGEGFTTKGQVLCSFLQHVGLKHRQQTGSPGYFPKVIFLIDDRKKNLEDVEIALKSCNDSIEFVGLEYQGAFSYAPQDISEEDFEKFWTALAEKSQSAFDSSHQILTGYQRNAR